MATWRSASCSLTPSFKRPGTRSRRQHVAGQLADFVTSYEGLLAAIVSLGLMVAVVAFRHVRPAPLLVRDPVFHPLTPISQWHAQPQLATVWISLGTRRSSVLVRTVSAVGAALVLYRVVGPLALYSRHRFRVQSVERETRGMFSIYISGRDLHKIGAEAGQFAIWRFLDRKRWWQAHPFSFSAVPDRRRLRITVKNIGDFSGAIHNVKPGTPILVEGPFGKFTERPVNEKVLLVAGGIGITPIPPLAEVMAIDGFDVRVLYRAHSEGDVVFKHEMEALTGLYALRVDYLLTRSGSRKMSREGWFAPGALSVSSRTLPSAWSTSAARQDDRNRRQLA